MRIISGPISHTDAIIIGGGHNGLTCAAYLAGAGLSVTVLEKNAVAGGAAMTEEFHPGFRNSVAAYTVSLLNPKVIRDLELARHGLVIAERPAANFWPVDENRSLLMPYGLAARQKAIAAFCERDAARLPAYDAALERAGGVLRDLVLTTPPNAGGGWLELIKGGVAARKTLGLNVEDQRVLLDLFTKSAAHFLAQWFENDVVRGAFGFDGIVGAYASPYTPGTAYVLLHHCFGEANGKSGVWGHAMGGMGAISQAMAASAVERGAVIRTGCEVAEVVVEGGRAVGVRLADGEVLRARVVAANVGPKLLFGAMMPNGAVLDDVRRRFTGIKTGSGTFRMNVALAALPDFTCRPGMAPGDHHGAGIVFGPTLDYMDRAFMDARLNGWSREPVVEMLIPSTIDPSLAPAGKHVASLFVQHVAPRLPDGRIWDEAKVEFAQVVIDTVTRHAPNFRSSILGMQVLSPMDLERRFGMVDGDIFHGQLGLDQMFSARPVLGYGAYRMPLAGLYLCGAGAHPGGGVTGVPGHNAAREIVKDLRGGWIKRAGG
ncbi:MAG: NAD(P)/FAD-dependent oxidoreductase [Hyphomicrobiaceae bacterium]